MTRTQKIIVGVAAVIALYLVGSLLLWLFRE